MKKTQKTVAALLLSACCVIAVTCNPLTVSDAYLPLYKDSLGSLTQITAAMGLTVESCCAPTYGSNANLIDGNESTTWLIYANSDRNSDAYHAHGTGHYITFDLGQVYENITRIEYVPRWRWNGAESAVSSTYNADGHNGANHGICTAFSIYVSETKIDASEKFPAETLAGQGEWTALEYGSNDVQTAAKHKFFATINSVRGRYVQFHFNGYYTNSWTGYPAVAKMAQANEMRIWVSEKPFKIDLGPLTDITARAERLRAAYLPRYGYTNGILDNWAVKAETYINGSVKTTLEQVNYVYTNMKSYYEMAVKRMGDDTYDRFVPKILWADDRGNHLQAHGGGVMWDPISKKWWFYGEDRTSRNGGGQPGVHGYSSIDLYNWKDEGVVMPVFNNTVYDTYGFGPADYDGTAVENTSHTMGLIPKINAWRKALGDWNVDGVIDFRDQPYEIPADLKSELTSTRGLVWWDTVAAAQPPNNNDDKGFLVDEKSAWDPANKKLWVDNAWYTADQLWEQIKGYIPQGNPPMYIPDGADSRPYAGALGLDSAKIAAFNALYADIPVWKRKQMYRHYNYQTTIERPKVIFNDGRTGKVYTDGNGYRYPYVMFIHIEAGAYASGYGNARVLIAAARNPQGPFKMIWAYRVHFVENLRSSDNGFNKGMTRDQGVMIDSDGTAYQFGSTEENRFMCINKLGPDYTTIEGIPPYATGGNQNEFLMEGYQNRMGVNFNWIFGNQREAPAPFVHYETLNMTMDGDGSHGSVPPVDSVKRYYAVTSYSSGWFPNPQGVYRTAAGGNYILGGKPHDKPSQVEPTRLSASTGNNLAEDTTPGTNWQTGNGWVATGNDSGVSGSDTTLLFGQAGDGSHVSKGFDGQTTHVFQLRYPDHPWGIVGYGDDGYVPLIPGDYADAQTYYDALDALNGTADHTKPVYGERTELDEPRKGRLVYGKYVYLSDSWDSTKNYDARYIWLPLRALPENQTDSGTAGHRYGLRVRWMDQWRWQDFVYELGPFKDCLIRDPAGIDIWNDVANDIAPLAQYYEMLGDMGEYMKNAGKQISGSY